MKAFVLFFLFLISIGCVSKASSINEATETAQPTPTIEVSNADNKPQFPYPDYQYDKTLLEKLNVENERFRQTPDEFKSVDFKNFKYDFGRLKDGEFEKYTNNNRIDGTERYFFKDVFYVDLTGDSKKEAVVFNVRVICGGSCDGGADWVYFYSSNNGKPQLIDTLKTGSTAYSCSIKTFTVRDKKINVEQFGRCADNSSRDATFRYVCKFCIKDETHSVYSLDKTELKRLSSEIIETQGVKIMNAPAFVSIND